MSRGSTIFLEACVLVISVGFGDRGGMSPIESARRSGTTTDTRSRPRGIGLGRAGGVPVRMHLSVLIIMGLIAWGLAGGVFPAAYPGRPGWEYVAVGVTAAIVFFLGLLAHEISHVVVARRNSIEVESITLWLFGGVAILKGEAKSPGAELRIAGVGPLVSLLLGVVFGLLAGAAAWASFPSLLVLALSWLAGINVVLAVFNALPGAPLDGGRLLKAALWKWRGDRVWASVMAARAGRGLGMIMILIGLVSFVYATNVSALWFALIGWFILGAAGAEERSTELTTALTGVRVRDVMTSSPDTAPSDISVAQFIDQYLFTHRHSTFPLVRDGRLVGLVTMSRVMAVPEHRRAGTSLREIASPLADVPVTTPDESIIDLLSRLNGAADRRALVLSGDELVGIVSPFDISRAFEHAGLRRAVSGAASR